MAGFFDFLTGGGQAPAPGLLDAAGYMDPAQYDAARRSQGMMGLWAGLLQGGGPSLEPRNFSSALGAGLIGQQKFGTEFDEGAQHRATAQAKLAEIDLKKKGYQLAQDYISGKGDIATPADAARGAGTGTGAVPDFGTGGGGGGGGGGWGPHAATAIDTLKAAGYSDAAIQGIMANGLGEGGFKTNWQKAGGGENSFGHWQFNERGELPGLRAFAQEQGGDPTDTRIQALYVAKRAEEVSPGFSKLTDPKLATDLFATKFEKYHNAKFGQRYGLLADAQRYMAGIPVEERQPIPPGPGGYAPAPSGAIPQFAEGRAGALGGPVPEAVAGGPAAPVPAPLVAGAPAGNRPGANLPQRGAGLVTPQDYERWLATQQAPPAAQFSGRVEQLAGNAAPAGAPQAGPQFGYGSAGGAISPAAMAAAAGGPPPPDAPPIPAPLVAPAPAIPSAPAGAAPVAMPPAPAAPGAAPAPGPMTVTLPAPPEPLAMPAAPAARPLPPAPETPAIPARPVIPGGGAGTAPAVSPQVDAQARRAQGVVLGLTMMGVHVPDFLQKEAGIAIAGRTAAAEAEAKQPIELQNKMFEASLTAAQKRWDALTKDQQDEVAWQRGLTGDQLRADFSNIHERYKTVLKLATEPQLQRSIAEQTSPTRQAEETQKTNEQIRKEDETPREFKQTINGQTYTYWASPKEQRERAAATAAPVPSVVAPGAAVPGAAPPGAAPIPGGALPPGAVLTDQGERLKGIATGTAAQQIKVLGEIQDQGNAARRASVDTNVLLNAGKIDMQGPLAEAKQTFNRLTQSVLGWNSNEVKTYEEAQYLMGQQIRSALRASDPNPTGKQQEMLMQTFPTHATSEAGYKSELRYMQGIQDWQMNRQERLNAHLNNPNNPNRDPQGFDDTMSALPFVFMRMAPADQDAYLARIGRADPAAARQLVEQATSIGRR